MEQLIEQQTSGDLERRDALADQRALKELELEDLRRRVAVLEAERDAVEAELDDCDGKIKLARSKFERQLQRLAQRDQMVKASAKDCEREASVLDAERARQACSGALVAADLSSRRRVAETAASELDAADRLANSKPVWQADEVDDDDEALRQPRKNCEEAEASLREACSKRDALDDDALVLRNALKALDDRLPELERQKKAAAAARNYKEAGALAKEAKELSTTREAKEEKLAALSEPRSAALAAVAREADVVVLRSLRRRARALKRCRRALSGQTGLRLDAAADALVRCELATLDARCADLKRKSGLGDVAESSDSEASQNGVVEEEAPASPAPAVSEEAPAAAEEEAPEAAEAKAALAARL